MDDPVDSRNGLPPPIVAGATEQERHLETLKSADKVIADARNGLEEQHARLKDLIVRYEEKMYVSDYQKADQAVRHGH